MSSEKNISKFIRSMFDEYLDEADWRVKENSNSTFSFGALNKYTVGKTSALYWKGFYDMFNKNIMKGHDKGDYHIHDLGGLASYCFGASLEDLLRKGITNIPNVSESAPSKRLRAITSQIANIMTIFQNETMGAIAFSSWNVYLAPFLYFDKLRREKLLNGGILKKKYEKDPFKEKVDLEYSDLDMADITESVQNMIYALNSNSRAGAEPAFTNVTLDFKVLKPMRKKTIIIEGNDVDGFTYGDFQKEADILTKVFAKMMLQGDAEGNAFSYPIPTFNINKDMDWDNPNYTDVWELSAKYGVPYFGNFISSDLDEEDVYSMCCRLRLNKRQLMNKTGGLFGSAEKTGSLGVFTVNLPKIGYKAKEHTKIFLFNEIERKMETGKSQLMLKKNALNKFLKIGLYPALKEYLGNFDTLFMTIGLVGANEMVQNFTDGRTDISSGEGRALIKEVLEFMKDKLADFQEETGELFNLEATPAESTAFRLAKKSKEEFPDIITAGTEERPYFTNSVHLPVGIEWDYNEIYKHQDGLLSEFTGGSVYHNYLKQSISGLAVKKQVKTAFEKYDIPYMSNSPLYSICPTHGYLKGYNESCPKCGADTDSYQRVTGYIRRIDNFNKGKAQEFEDRNQKELDLDIE